MKIWIDFERGFIMTRKKEISEKTADIRIVCRQERSNFCVGLKKKVV